MEAAQTDKKLYQNDPAGQCKYAEAPVELTKDPAGACKHEVAALNVGAYVPTPQNEQFLTSDTYCPLLQPRVQINAPTNGDLSHTCGEVMPLLGQ